MQRNHTVLLNADGTVNMEAAVFFSRPYPIATAGTPIKVLQLVCIYCWRYATLRNIKQIITLLKTTNVQKNWFIYSYPLMFGKRRLDMNFTGNAMKTIWWTKSFLLKFLFLKYIFLTSSTLLRLVAISLGDCLQIMRMSCSCIKNLPYLPTRYRQVPRLSP